MLPGPPLPATFVALLFAQAEPAPPPAPQTGGDPAPRVAEAPTGPPATALGFGAAAAFRFGAAGRDVPPRLGFSIHPSFEWRYAHVAGWLELGAQLDFSFDRFAERVTLAVPLEGGQEAPFDDLRTVSHFDFAALQTVGFRVRRVRPWGAAGVGVSLAHFSTLEPEYRPGEQRATRPVVRGAAGVDVDVFPQTSVGLRVDGAWMLFTPRLTTEGGRTISPFGDRLAIGAAVRYWF
jgi:hypothetical protein